MDDLPKYLFRGTTIGFEGNKSHQIIPCTCTSKNPVKAALFALACKGKFIAEPIIYVARRERLKTVALNQANVIGELEEEITFKIKPIDFPKYCDGYLTLEEMQQALKNIGIELNKSASVHNLSFLLEETAEVNMADIEKLYKSIEHLLKKS